MGQFKHSPPRDRTNWWTRNGWPDIGQSLPWAIRNSIR